MNKTLKIKGNVCLLASAACDSLLGANTGFLLRGEDGVNFLSVLNQLLLRVAEKMCTDIWQLD